MITTFGGRAGSAAATAAASSRATGTSEKILMVLLTIRGGDRARSSDSLLATLPHHHATNPKTVQRIGSCAMNRGISTDRRRVTTENRYTRETERFREL